MINVALAVVGSRSFNNYQFLSATLNQYDISTIISGAARGADSLAAQYAKEHNIPLKEFPAEWDKHGKSAGYIRNQQIVAEADIIICFWDGVSKGTKLTIDIAKKSNKPVHIYWPSDRLLDIC